MAGGMGGSSHSTSRSGGKSRGLDFEINLIPFIDLLSVCICFLLLTAVWVQVGSMNVKQAVGGQSQAETAKKAVLWVLMDEKGDVILDVRDSVKVAAKNSKLKIANKDGKVNFEAINVAVADLKNVDASLATALIQPAKASIYEEIIDLMDSMKKTGLSDLGVAPL